MAWEIPGELFLLAFLNTEPRSGYGTRTSQQSLGSGANNINFNQLVTGLTGGQTYHFRADLMNSFTIVATGTDQTFFVPSPPLANTVAAAPIHPGEAQLNANINPFNIPTTYWFQYGLTTNYGSFTASNTLSPGNNLFAVSALLYRAASRHQLPFFRRCLQCYRPNLRHRHEFCRSLRTDRAKRLSRRWHTVQSRGTFGCDKFPYLHPRCIFRAMVEPLRFLCWARYACSQVILRPPDGAYARANY